MHTRKNKTHGNESRAVANNLSTGSGGISRSRPVQMKKTGTIEVYPEQHADAVDAEPHDKDHAVGFKMPVKFIVDPAFALINVSDRFSFLQYVKDEYEVQDSAGTPTLTQAYGAWNLDDYGFDDAKGDWSSDHSTTSWEDTPGFVEGREIPAGNVLSKYEVKFFWEVKDKGKSIHKTNEITLTAESDDKDNVTYDTEDVNYDIDLPD